jgi:hypothetical protein
MTDSKYMPFWGSRIFWIALAVLAAFTAMIMSGKLVLDGAAVVGFLLAIVTSVVGLSRREQGDAGAPLPAAAPAIPPELASALTAMIAGMTPAEPAAAPEPAPEADEESGDDEEAADEEDAEKEEEETP